MKYAYRFTAVAVATVAGIVLGPGCSLDEREIPVDIGDASATGGSAGLLDASSVDHVGMADSTGAAGESNKAESGGSDSTATDSGGADVKADAPTCGDCFGPTAGSGTTVCENGTCKIKCVDGFTLCGTICADLQNDGMNCHDCGKKCGAGMVCQAGTCAVSCAAGLTNCGGNCVNLSKDVDHCGSCTIPCARPQANGMPVCNGACGIQCNGSLSYCGNTCVDTMTDKNNCGGCGVPCTGVCSGGLCCTGGTTNCGGRCVNTSTDQNNCGGCGQPCGGTCSGGLCCTGGTSNCSGTCVNLQTDANHCGVCTKVCSAGQKCQQGGCIKDCGALTLCGSNCYDLNTDTTHCRDCNTNCSVPNNGKATCTSTGCGIDCGANLKCNQTCCAPPAPDRVAVCIGGGCGIDCPSGVTTLTCTPQIAGQPACGSWTFETSGDTEGWTMYPGTANAATGAAYIATAPGVGHGKALAVNVVANDCPSVDNCHLNAAITGKVCPGGGLASFAGYGISVDVYFQRQNGTGSTNGPIWLETWNGTTTVSNSGDLTIIPNAWTTYSMHPTVNDPITELRINTSYSGSWSGTLFIDNIRFGP